MTATYDLTTPIGKVRLKIADTDVEPATDAHFTDEELEIFLDEAGDSDYLAVALALEAWAAALTESTDSERIGDYSYTRRSAENKLKLAERYRQMDSEKPALAWGSFNLTDTEKTEDVE